MEVQRGSCPGDCTCGHAWYVHSDAEREPCEGQGCPCRAFRDAEEVEP